MGRRPKKKVKKEEGQPPETEQIDWTAVQVPVPRRPVTRSQARILEAEKKLAKKKGKITKSQATPRRNLRVREKEKVVVEEKSYQAENATPPGSSPVESRRETRSARRAREEEERRARKEEYYKDKKMGKRVQAEDQGSAAADSDSDTVVDKMSVEDVVGSGNLPAIIVEFTKQDIIFKQKAEEFKAGMVIAVPEITLRFNPSLSSKVAINPTMGRFVIRREGPRGSEYLKLNMKEPFQELRDLDVEELILSICGQMKGK